MLDDFIGINLVTVGCGEGYERSARRLFKQAKKHKFFVNCLYFNEPRLEKVLPETKRNISLISKKVGGDKGFGLWFWKPDVILYAMAQTKENDIVAYLDAGCTLNLNNSTAIARLQEYASLASKNGILAMQLWYKEFDQPDLTDNFWGFGELNELIKIDDSKLHSNQIQAGILFIKNCSESRDFITKWKELMILDDFKYLIGPEKKEYRYDQSVFSLLYKSMGYPTMPDETYFHPLWEKTGVDYPIWATRINDGVDPFRMRLGDMIFKMKRRFQLTIQKRK